MQRHAGLQTPETSKPLVWSPEALDAWWASPAGGEHASSPVAALLERSDSKASVVSMESAASSAASIAGRKGFEKRMEAVRRNKEMGIKKKNRKPLDSEKTEECLKYIAENKPVFTKHESNKEGDWWKETGEYLEVPVHQLKELWKKRSSNTQRVQTHKAEVVGRTHRNRYARRRYEGRSLKGFRAKGAGSKRKLKELQAETRKKLKREEQIYGHTLNPEDVMQMWKET